MVLTQLGNVKLVEHLIAFNWVFVAQLIGNIENETNMISRKRKKAFYENFNEKKNKT